MSICQRKDGRYLVKYKDGGRWLQKTFRSLQDAEAFEGKVSYDEPENKRLTVSEAVVLFLSRTKHVQRTQEAYARVLERIGDEITTKYVDMLDRRDLENVRILLRDEWHLTNDGINRSVGYLKAAFRWCAAEDFIEEAPWTKYRDLPIPRREHLCGSFDDFRRIFAASSPALQWTVKTCLALCLRPGKEVTSLLWENIDLDHGRARVWMYKVSAEKVVALPSWWINEARPRHEASSPDEPVCLDSHGRPWRRLTNDGAESGDASPSVTVLSTRSGIWPPVSCWRQGLTSLPSLPSLGTGMSRRQGRTTYTPSREHRNALHRISPPSAPLLVQMVQDTIHNNLK